MSISRRLILAIAVGAIAAAAVGALLAQSIAAVVEQVGRAQAASEQAATDSERIIAALEDIAENLEKGARLSEKTSQIERLTDLQRRSLLRLRGILLKQLKILQRGRSSIADTTQSTRTLAGLNETQVDRLKATIASLKVIRAFAHDAAATGRELARLSRYGARLSEDSQRAFGP